MTTNAATWFYRDPERIPYYLEERINQTLWAARLYNLWLDCVSAEPPYKMAGTWGEASVEIEWQPEQFFTLRVSEGADANSLVHIFSRVLALRPSLSYNDSNGHFVTEWHTNGGRARWQKIQGKPGYRNPRRLSG